jgi:hypothetical protein
MAQGLQALIDAGYPVVPEIIARLSPYKTDHLNRFGQYELRFDHVPPPIPEDLQLSPPVGARQEANDSPALVVLVLRLLADEAVRPAP